MLGPVFALAGEGSRLRHKLKNHLSLQAKGFHGEIEELQQWLTDTERHLLASKPLGGLPETAKEQLNAHTVSAVFSAALALVIHAYQWKKTRLEK